MATDHGKVIRDKGYNNSGRVASGRHDFSRVAMPRSRVARWRAAELHGASGAVRNRSHTTEQHGHTTEVLPGAQPHDQNNMLLVSGYIFVDFQTVALAGIRLPFGRPNSGGTVPGNWLVAIGEPIFGSISGTSQNEHRVF